MARADIQMEPTRRATLVGDPASDSIGEVVSQGPGSRVALVEHLTVPWDKVCIFGP